MRFFFLIFLSFSNAYATELLAPEPVLRKLSDSTSISLLTAGTVLTLSTQVYDDRIRDDWKNYQQMSASAASVGDLLGSGLASLLVAGTQYLYDPQEEHWKSHARTLIWETSLVFAMKYSFGRQRPGNSSSYQSFPSGHTAVAFATATNLTYSYGWRAAALSFPIALFVGASRWADDMHWGSDVVAGAFIGVIIARACSESESPGLLTAGLTPIISPEFSGLNYLYSF